MYLKTLIILILKWAHVPLNFKQLPRYDLSKLERFDELLAFYIGKSQIFGHQNCLSFWFLNQLLHGLTSDLVSTIQATYFSYFFGIQCRLKVKLRTTEPRPTFTGSYRKRVYITTGCWMLACTYHKLTNENVTWEHMRALQISRFKLLSN